MSSDANKAVYRRFLELGFDTGNLAALDEVLAADYVDHDAPPGTPPGPDGIRQILGGFRAAFPDVAMAVEGQVAEGDLVATRYTMRGTHLGSLMGIPPTGKRVAMRGMTVARVVDGKMAEAWVVYDMLGLLQQLEVMPAPGAAAVR